MNEDSGTQGQVPVPWMTVTGAILLAVAGGLGGIAQLPLMAEWKPWMDAVAIFLGSTAASLMGQGIRRNIPTMRTSGRPETLTESREGFEDQPMGGDK